MKTSLLAAAVTLSATFLQACAGGAITDSNGKLIQGNGNSDLVVNFQNTSSGKLYTTGIDTYGYFGFDPYAPATATNNAVILPVGPYMVSVSSKSTSITQSTTYSIYHQDNDTKCPDHYVSGLVDSTCGLYQLELLGGALNPPAPSPSNILGYATTVIPLSSGPWCTAANLSLGVVDISPRYNDVILQVSPTPGVTWSWKVVSGNLDASGTVPTAATQDYPAGYVDLAGNFKGPPYALSPNTTYEVAFYPGGLASPCAVRTVKFTTTYDPVPTCVIDHDCPNDPGGGDSGNEEGSCSPGIDCCANGYCSDP